MFLRIKGLVATVMSLRELDNLYFTPFRTVYLFMFVIGIGHKWQKYALTDVSLEVAVM